VAINNDSLLVGILDRHAGQGTQKRGGSMRNMNPDRKGLKIEIVDDDTPVSTFESMKAEQEQQEAARKAKQAAKQNAKQSANPQPQDNAHEKAHKDIEELLENMMPRIVELEKRMDRFENAVEEVEDES